MTPEHINTRDFNYDLPDERVAQFPLDKRDDSKLLIFNADCQINDAIFNEIADYLPEKSLLVFNETRVIRARLEFVKDTGARIEVFCLEPVAPYAEFSNALNVKYACSWRCLVGNAKKWKEKTLINTIDLNGVSVEFRASINKAETDSYIVDFSWDADVVFGEIIENLGHTPLPPYIKRSDMENDTNRYQTIYANTDGSVAAPTAGLHFTEDVLQRIGKRHIKTESVVLHVGAGTFKPMKGETVSSHEMHAETIIIKKHTIIQILQHLEGNIINVGTTTVRTMESMYWFGVKLLVDGFEKYDRLEVKQWDPYNKSYNCGITSKEALNALLEFMHRIHSTEISGSTQLMIVPGYTFHLTDILITNFHQPQSTLLLLVSAFTKGKWKEIYEHALYNKYRFLSYGDSCLLLNNTKVKD